MELIRYLLTNIWKRPLRAAFIVIASTLSSVLLVFTVSLGFRVMAHTKADTIAKRTGHLWVSASENFRFDEDRLGDYGREARAIREFLSADGNVAAFVPWKDSYCEIQTGTKRDFSQILATDFELDKPLRDATELMAGSFPGADDEYGIILASALADKRGVKIGDSVTIFIPSVFGARNAMDFYVMGIFRASSPFYENTIGLRSTDYLAMAELTGLSPFYKAYVNDESRIPAMVKDLKKLAPDFKVQAYDDDGFVRFLLSLGMASMGIFGSMAMIIFLALLIGINSIILTNIFDRRDEIGTLRALGFSRSTVRNLFFGEAVISLLVGYLIGAGVVGLVGAYFEANIVRPPLLMLQYMFGMTRMGISFTPLTALLPFALLFVLLFLASYRRIGVEAEKQAVDQMANR